MVTEVACHNLVGEGQLAVAVLCGIARKSLCTFDIWIIEGVDVDGQSLCVFRQLVAAADSAETETRGIVSPHRLLVVGIVVVDETHALNGIVGMVELAENINQVLCDGFVTHQLTLLHLSTGIVVEHAQIAQVTTRNATSHGKRAALHAKKHCVSKCVYYETLLGLSHWYSPKEYHRQ